MATYAGAYSRSMTLPQFILADATRHRAQLLELNTEYLRWVVGGFARITGRSPADMLGMEVEPYVESTVDKVCGDAPPRGAFYLVHCEGALAGMGGLRCVRDAVAEVKRIYVRPAFRGRQLGEAILLRVLSDAKAFGYQTMRLDSAPFMQSAHRIYERHGFVDRPPYDEAEPPKELHPIIRFMEKSL
ncbi:MAG: GNAT family N-acetyltransferase [Rhodoferax sp.]|nr:GNAT family N-acetyltransferase [Rhodoferax sp.]